MHHNNPFNIPPAPRVPAYAPIQRQPNDNAIDWNGRFITLRPEWYQNAHFSKFTAGVLGGTSLVSGGLAIAAFFFMKEKPAIVLSTVNRLGITTLITGLTSAYFWKRESWQDPEYRKEVGISAELDIVNNHLSIKEIEQKYGHLQAYDLLTNDDLNRLMRNQIFNENFSYRSTMNKIKGSPQFSMVLDETNKEMMLRKLIIHLQKETIQDNELEVIGVTQDQLDIYICSPAFRQLNEKEIGYAEFLQRVALSRWRKFSQEELRVIKAFAIPFYIDQDIGISKTIQKPDAIYLKISIQELVAAGALINDLGKISYPLFRNKHSIDSFVFLNDNEQNIVCQAYLISYKQIREFPDDAALFGYESEELLRDRFEREFAAIKSFQDLIEKMGVSVFIDKRLTKVDPRLMKLVLEFLKGSSYHVPSNSPLKEYDLMISAVSAAVSDAQEQENRLMKSIQENKKRLENTCHSEKEEARNKAAALKKQMSRESTLATAQTNITKLEKEKKSLQGTIEDSFATIVKINTSYQELEKHQKEMEGLRQKNRNDQETEEELLIKKVLLTQSIEEKNRLKNQLDNFNQLKNWKEKIAELDKEIEKKEKELQATKDKEVTGYFEASKADSQANSLLNEKKALISKKEALIKKVEGVKVLNESEERDIKERLLTMLNLESELEIVKKKAQESQNNSLGIEANLKKTKELREFLNQNHSEYTIKDRLEILYKNKERTELELQKEKERMQQIKAEHETIQAEIDQNLTLALQKIEEKYQAELNQLNQRESMEKGVIKADFDSALNLIK